MSSSDSSFSPRGTASRKSTARRAGKKESSSSSSSSGSSSDSTASPNRRSRTPAKKLAPLPLDRLRTSPDRKALPRSSSPAKNKDTSTSASARSGTRGLRDGHGGPPGDAVKSSCRSSTSSRGAQAQHEPSSRRSSGRVNLVQRALSTVSSDDDGKKSSKKTSSAAAKPSYGVGGVQPPARRASGVRKNNPPVFVDTERPAHLDAALSPQMRTRPATHRSSPPGTPKSSEQRSATGAGTRTASRSQDTTSKTSKSAPGGGTSVAPSAPGDEAFADITVSQRLEVGDIEPNLLPALASGGLGPPSDDPASGGPVFEESKVRDEMRKRLEDAEFVEKFRAAITKCAKERIVPAGPTIADILEGEPAGGESSPAAKSGPVRDYLARHVFPAVEPALAEALSRTKLGDSAGVESLTVALAAALKNARGIEGSHSAVEDLSTLDLGSNAT